MNIEKLISKQKLRMVVEHNHDIKTDVRIFCASFSKERLMFGKYRTRLHLNFSYN